MQFRSIFFVTGIFLLILSVTMFFPALADWSASNPDWKIFVFSSLITSFIGGFMVLVNSGETLKINLRQAFLLTSVSWLVLTFFASIPLWLSAPEFTFTNAFFEAMSGLTTTGSTVLTNLDFQPPGILVWRSILQWLGGIGIIVMAISVLPFLKVGGMQLFQTESSEQEKVLPRAAQLAGSIGIIYVGLTFLCVIAYMMAGMSSFNAVNHAMTTIATGGFSTHDLSLGFYQNHKIHLVTIVFMLVSALPFVLYLKAIKGNWKSIFKDSQVKWFLSIVAIFISIMMFYLYHNSVYSNFDNLFFKTTFNVISVITGTGYATTNYMLWGSFAIGLLFFLSFVGGCAGSTTCAIKVFRFQIIYAVSSSQLKKLLHPHGIFIPKYNGYPIPKDVPMSVLSFVFLYGMTFVVAASLLQLIGLDFITAMSGAATAISNVGPGLGEIIGPSGNFSTLPDSAKWILSICMLLGRLELFTVLVIFLPQFWQR